MTQRAHAAGAATRQRVEAAVLAALLAHDRPWRVSDLQRAVPTQLPTGPAPASLVRVSVETLRADGLLTDWHRPWRHDRAQAGGSPPGNTTPHDQRLVRASWTAVRAAELLAARGEHAND